MELELSTPRAYKRSPGLSNSTWYKGLLVSQMAGTADNNGAFDLVISKMRAGTEPPPHVHSREDEFMYIFSGEMRFYGMSLITPGGFLDAINKMNVPAEQMEVPTDTDVETYANADLTQTIKVFEKYGIRFLSPQEIRREMPEYPLGD
jgi:hypothetical protein